MSFTYDHARPALTSDCVVFGLDEDDIKVLLIHPVDSFKSAKTSTPAPAVSFKKRPA